MDSIDSPFARPFYLMVKPAGAACNLACEYCYYLDKSRLYDTHGKRGSYMDDSMLEIYVREYIAASPQDTVLFTWHGGEALLRDIRFYERALELQARYAGGRRIDNCIQTNGTLLNEEWCRFFRDNGFLVGLSVDGPRDVHDTYRVTPLGKPTFQKVMTAARLLDRYGVEWNAMAVVNDVNVKRPLEFYRFFRDTLGCRYLQFAPIVERYSEGRMLSPDEPGGVMAPFSITPEEWGEFLCTIFDEWVRNDVGQMFVQLFDATLCNWVGITPGTCTMAAECGHAPVMEHNGDVYSCDHFVYPEHYLGNITTSPLIGMMISDKQRRFGASKRDALPRQCRECLYLHLCNGECPKNRIVLTADGEPGLNYLCEGFHRFFAHSEPYMRFMADEYLHNRPPGKCNENGAIR